MGVDAQLAAIVHDALPACVDNPYWSARAIEARIPLNRSPSIFNSNASGFLQVLDVREHKLDRKQLDPKEIFARYLHAVQQVTEAVDTMLENRS